MKLILIILAFYLFLLVCWAFYLGVMMLAQKKDEITNPWVRFIAYQELFIGLALDLILNVLASVFILADYPHGWKFTDSLKFQKARGGRRGAIAAWICAELLNRFDPKGTHC